MNDNHFEAKPVEANLEPEIEFNRSRDLGEMAGRATTEGVKKLIPYLLTVAVLISAGFSVYFWNEARSLKANLQKAAQEETINLVSNLVAQVGNLIVLPEGEMPTVATVSDPEKLQDQPFFARAQRGDKVLIYTNSKKAILYNPESNKIVEVAPINIGNPSETPIQ